MKIIIKGIMIFVAACTLNVSHETFNATTAAEPKIKTSIKELLDEPEKLFLSSEAPYIDSKASFLMNRDTGQVIYTEDGEYPLPVLSITKALAAYVIFDKLAENKPEFTMETKIKAKGRPVLVSYEYNFSNVSLYEGENYTVRELLDAIMINSANGALMLVGEFIAGSEAKFVNLMREKVKSLGLKQTTVYTSTGLDKADLVEYGYVDLEDGVNSMSSADVAYMVMQFSKDYPEILTITSKAKGIFATLTSDPIEYDTTIALLNGQKYFYAGVNGFKTGGDIPDYTSTIVFTATVNDINLVGVILGAKNSEIRSEEVHKLLDYGYKSIFYKTVITPENKLFNETSKIPVKYGDKKAVTVAVDRKMMLASSYENLNAELYFTPTNEKYSKKYEALTGIIRKGEIIGKISVPYNDLNFLTGTEEESYTVNVIAMEDINNGFYLFSWAEKVGDTFKELFFRK
ncbi:MAG: D-alanyl-D-alanine carboxypeptidase family protein [Culicoidibacterales bacterium]